MTSDFLGKPINSGTTRLHRWPVYL